MQSTRQIQTDQVASLRPHNSRWQNQDLNVDLTDSVAHDTEEIIIVTLIINIYALGFVHSSTFAWMPTPPHFLVCTC